MAAKKCYLMYKSWNPMLLSLSDEQLGQVMKSVIELQEGMDSEPSDSTLKAIFLMIKATMQEDADKYESTCEKRKKAAESKWMQMDAFASKCMQKDANAGDTDTESDTDNDKDIKEKNIKKKSQSFSPPTAEEVKHYVDEMGYRVDADRFVDFYSSKGWMIGKNKMKDWKAAVRTWSKQEQRLGVRQDNKPSKYRALMEGLM